MAKKEAIIKKVLSCFFIIVILMSVVPISAFASVNPNITSNELNTTQSTPQSNAESLKGKLHILSSDLTLTSPDLTLTRADYNMSIAVEDVSGLGRYTEATAEGKKLLYDYPDARTSYTTIRIDGNDYCQNDTMDSYVTQMPTIVGDSITTKWTLPPNVDVSQDLALMPNTTQYRLTVTNNDHASHHVMVRYLFDTMLAYEDGAPFRVPDVGDITTEQEFENPVFNYWKATDSLANPTLTSNCTFVPGNKPDKVQFAYWSDIVKVPFDYTITEGRDITSDTAVGMYWDLGTLTPGKTKEVTAYYGTGFIPPPPTITKIQIIDLFTEYDSYLSGQNVRIYAYSGNFGEVSLVNGQLAINITNPKAELVFENVSAITINPDQTISPCFTYNLPLDAVGGVYTINAAVYDAEMNLLDQEETIFRFTTIKLSISPKHVTTSIGGSTKYAIRANNPSEIAVPLNLSLSGLDDSWYTLSKESLILNAGGEEAVILNVKIPESPDNTGEYNFNVSAAATSASAVLDVVLEPLLYALSPPDAVILSSNDLLFSWKTSVKSTTELYIKQETEADFVKVTGESGLDHAVTVENLTRNTNYVWYAKSCTSFACGISDNRALYIDNGIVFTKDRYDFTVERDYDQPVSVSVKNMDSEPHDLLVRANNPYNDLFVGFVGGGSIDKLISLNPGETKDIKFVIHAQDSLLDEYTFTANLTNIGTENITDYALIHVNIRRPNVDFTITEVSTNPRTLVKTYKVQNRGDPITDFKVSLDDAIKDNVYLQPEINHGYLKTGDSIDVNAIPLFSEECGTIEGNIIAEGARESKSVPANFECSDGTELFLGHIEYPLYEVEINDWYCINNPEIDADFSLPAGFNADDVIYGKLFIDFSLPWDRSTYAPHNVYISINGKEVGKLMNTIPEGRYSFDLDPSVFNYAEVGKAGNKIHIHTVYPTYAHFVSNTHLRIQICLEELERWVCASTQEEANASLWEIPGIQKPSSNMNVVIISPSEGDSIALGESTLVKASVTGDYGAELYATVKATFSNSDFVLELKDDGIHDDGAANDGVYANMWVPDKTDGCKITVSASDCVAGGSDSINVAESFIALSTNYEVYYKYPKLNNQKDPIVVIANTKIPDAEITCKLPSGETQEAKTNKRGNAWFFFREGDYNYPGDGKKDITVTVTLHTASSTITEKEKKEVEFKTSNLDIGLSINNDDFNRFVGYLNDLVDTPDLKLPIVEKGGNFKASITVYPDSDVEMNDVRAIFDPLNYYDSPEYPLGKHLSYSSGCTGKVSIETGFSYGEYTQPKEWCIPKRYEMRPSKEVSDKAQFSDIEPYVNATSPFVWVVFKDKDGKVHRVYKRFLPEEESGELRHISHFGNVIVLPFDSDSLSKQSMTKSIASAVGTYSMAEAVTEGLELYDKGQQIHYYTYGVKLPSLPMSLPELPSAKMHLYTVSRWYTPKIPVHLAIGPGELLNGIIILQAAAEGDHIGVQMGVFDITASVALKTVICPTAAVYFGGIYAPIAYVGCEIIGGLVVDQINYHCLGGFQKDKENFAEMGRGERDHLSSQDIFEHRGEELSIIYGPEKEEDFGRFCWGWPKVSVSVYNVGLPKKVEPYFVFKPTTDILVPNMDIIQRDISPVILEAGEKETFKATTPGHNADYYILRTVETPIDSSVYLSEDIDIDRNIDSFIKEIRFFTNAKLLDGITKCPVLGYPCYSCVGKYQKDKDILQAIEGIDFVNTLNEPTKVFSPGEEFRIHVKTTRPCELDTAPEAYCKIDCGSFYPELKVDLEIFNYTDNELQKIDEKSGTIEKGGKAVDPNPYCGLPGWTATPKRCLIPNSVSFEGKAPLKEDVYTIKVSLKDKNGNLLDVIKPHIYKFMVFNEPNTDSRAESLGSFNITLNLTYSNDTAITNATVVSTVYRPDSSSDEITLHEASPGFYSAEYTKDDVIGIYEIVTRADINSTTTLTKTWVSKQSPYIFISNVTVPSILYTNDPFIMEGFITNNDSVEKDVNITFDSIQEGLTYQKKSMQIEANVTKEFNLSCIASAPGEYTGIINLVNASGILTSEVVRINIRKKPVHDVAMNLIEYRDYFWSGETRILPFNLANIGDFNETFDLNVTASEGWNVSLPQQILQINVGDTERLYLTIAAPNVTHITDGNISLVAYSNGTEISRLNMHYFVQEPRPLIEFEPESISFTIPVNNSVNIPIRIWEVGGASDADIVIESTNLTSWKENKTIPFILSSDQIHVERNFYSEIFANITIPEDSSGLYTASIETQLNNRSYKVEFEVKVIDIKPDLLPTEITYDPINLLDEENVTITTVVDNEGATDANDTVVSLKIGNNLVDSKTIDIYRNSYVILKFNWTSLPGRHNIMVIADSTNAIEESDESNNEESIEIVVQSTMPDLIVTLDAPSIATIGNTYEINATIENQGLRDAGTFELGFYINDNPKEIRSISILNGGNKITETFSWQPTVEGIYNLKVRADIEKVVNESIETNNKASKNVTASGGKIIYVDDDFIDDPANHKWNTIQEGIMDANDGDTIIVRDGTYTENIDVTNPHLTIMSENGADCTIVQAANPTDHVFEIIADYVNLSGFTLKNATGSWKAGIYLASEHSNISNNNASNNYNGIYLSSASSNQFTDNIANTNNNCGILLRNESNSNVLTNNTANFNTNFGIFLYPASNNILTNNTANSNEWNGMHLDYSNNNMLISNTANTNKMDGISLNYPSSNNTLINNTANSNNRDGFHLWSSSSNKLKSNIANSNHNYGISLSSTANNNISCNWVVQNKQGGFHITDGCTGNIIKDNNIVTNGESIGDSRHYNFYNDQSDNVIAENNYWGTGSLTMIAASIYDGGDDPSKGVVDFEPFLTEPAPCAPGHGPALPIHNINTGKGFSTIQAAIDDLDTKYGHTIAVDAGTYYEHVAVNKSIDLMGIGYPVVDASGSGNAITVSADNCTIDGFITRNSGPQDYNSGIHLASSNNSTISDNIVFDNRWGISASQSRENKIANNELSNNSIGIVILFSSNNNTIKDNSIQSNYNGSGIYLQSSADSNTIVSNRIFQNSEGIVLHECDNNQIINNIVRNDTIRGIRLHSSNYNVVSANTISNNSDIGIHLAASSANNTVINNTISDNVNGIYLSNSKYNKIANNIALTNDNGISLASADNNFLEYNMLLNNSNGVYLHANSGYNTVRNNTAKVNNRGIALAEAHNNSIKNNLLSHNTADGIYLHASSSYNTIADNDCSNNGHGISLDDSNNNLICLNNFIKNVNNVFSYKSANIWNSPEKTPYTFNKKTYTNYLGNYWNDYTGSDANGDGIGDTPYSINSVNDNYPLIERFENYPIIIENQPPTASFIYWPEKPDINQMITFDASLSKDPDGYIVSYEWDFGDRGYGTGKLVKHAISSAEVVTHSYSSAGNYDVTLTVTDNDGAVNSTSKSISVTSGYIIGGEEFTKRKTITIDNTRNANTLTEYQLKLDVIYDPEMQPDFDDLRFTDSNDNSLNYWVDDYAPSARASVWVKIPLISGSGTTTGYMYYGNPSASSQSNGDATFDIFEDFDVDDGEWTEYDPNNKIELDYTTNHRLEFNNWIRTDPGYVVKSYSTRNFVEEYDIDITNYWGNANTIGPGFSDTFGTRDQWQNGVGTEFYAGFGDIHSFIMAFVDGNKVWGHSAEWPPHPNSIDVNKNTPYYVRLEKFENTVKLSIFSDPDRTTHIAGSPKEVTTNLAARNFNYYYLVTGYTASPPHNPEWTTGWMDNFKVRKYAEPKPTITIGGIDPSPLIDGVDSLCALGVPGPLSALNSAPVPVVAGDNDTTPVPSIVVMASGLGNGRVVALSGGFFHNDAIKLYDNKQFANNVIAWLDKLGRKKVLITRGHREWGSDSMYDIFKAELESRGYTVTRFSGTITPSVLSDVGVVLIGTAWGTVLQSEIDALTDFVTNGGGLFLTGLGWSWEPYNPPYTLDEYPMNNIAEPYGIRWIDGYIRDPTNNYEGQPIFHTFYPNIRCSVH